MRLLFFDHLYASGDTGTGLSASAGATADMTARLHGALAWVGGQVVLGPLCSSVCACSAAVGRYGLVPPGMIRGMLVGHVCQAQQSLWQTLFHRLGAWQPPK